MIAQDNNPFKMNLQLHALPGEEPPAAPIPGYESLDGDITAMLAGEGAQVPAEPPAAPVVNPGVPLVADPAAPAAAPTEPVVPAEPAPAAPEPAPTQPVNPLENPVIQELMKVVQQQQQAIQQQSEMMQNFINTSMTNNSPQPSPQVTKTPEEIEAEKQAFMDRFYENPMAVLDEYAEKKVKSATDPLQQKISAYDEDRAWGDAIGTVERDTATFPEFQNVRAKMSDIIFKDPVTSAAMARLSKPEALAMAYKLAIAENMPAPAAQPPVQQPVQQPVQAPMDAAAKVKMLMEDPEVAKLYQIELAKQIESNNQQVPPMSPSSGVSNVAPYIKDTPKDWNELDADIKNSLSQGLL